MNDGWNMNKDHALLFSINSDSFLFVLQSGSNVKYVPATQIIYDPNEKRLTMYITMERAGCYHAKVSYGDVKLKNGDFDIIVLSRKYFDS